jgi:hypothetical protein
MCAELTFVDADPEERDSFDRSAFHIAIQHGHISIFTFFLNRYPFSEQDSAAVLSPPKTSSESRGYSLLRMAIESLSVPMVQAILKEKLYDQADLEEAWNVVNTQEELLQSYGNEHQHRKPGFADLETAWKDIEVVIMKTGDFTRSIHSVHEPLRDLKSPSPSIDRTIDRNPEPSQEHKISHTRKSSTKSERRKKKKRNHHDAEATTTHDPISSPLVEEESNTMDLGHARHSTSIKMQEEIEEVHPGATLEQDMPEVVQPITSSNSPEEVPIVEDQSGSTSKEGPPAGKSFYLCSLG